jgi:hypothetical protein
LPGIDSERERRIEILDVVTACIVCWRWLFRGVVFQCSIKGLTRVWDLMLLPTPFSIVACLENLMLIER